MAGEYHGGPETYSVLTDPVLMRQRARAEAVKRGLPMPKRLLKQMAQEEAHSRGLCTYRSFEEFVQHRAPHLLKHEYMRVQVRVANEVAEHQRMRVMVIIPTQYGKSEIWSRLLPAYYLLKYPNRMVALSSYGAELAWELSGEARDNYAAVGGQFKTGSPKGATRNWKTARRSGQVGGMWATGIGGPGLGRGFNLGITDDPISPDQATRGPYLRRFQKWWPATWLRGQRRGGAPLVFVMQRLGVDDPIDWLLTREVGKTAEHWHILALDEIHSAEKYGRWDGPLGFPKTCTVEKDWRNVGEVLAPEFRSPAEVAKLQGTSTPTVVAAQRQQRPMRPTGDFWALKWFEGRVYDLLPADAHNGGWDWDPAYTKEEKNSASAGVKTFRGAGDDDTFKIYVDDVQWDWLEFPELVKLLKDLIGPHYVEQKASGKSVVQSLKAYGITAEEVKVSGDKLARASAVQPAATTGRVYISKLVYDKLLYGEQQGLLRITAEALQEDGEGLDLNDAFVQALFRHLGIGAKRKKKAGFR